MPSHSPHQSQSRSHYWASSASSSSTLPLASPHKLEFWIEKHEYDRSVKNHPTPIAGDDEETQQTEELLRRRVETLEQQLLTATNEYKLAQARLELRLTETNETAWVELTSLRLSQDSRIEELVDENESLKRELEDERQMNDQLKAELEFHKKDKEMVEASRIEGAIKALKEEMRQVVQEVRRLEEEGPSSESKFSSSSSSSHVSLNHKQHLHNQHSPAQSTSANNRMRLEEISPIAPSSYSASAAPSAAATSSSSMQQELARAEVARRREERARRRELALSASGNLRLSKSTAGEPSTSSSSSLFALSKTDIDRAKKLLSGRY